MMKTRGIRTLVIYMLAAAALPLVHAGPSIAATSHVFDPQHSLTGGCTTSGDDLVPDPGCPYPPPPDGPSESFNRTTGLAIDDFGNVYVAVQAPVGEDNAHIDIFDSASQFITEVHVGGDELPSVAVDSQGYLYINTGGETILRFDPVVYNPAGKEISYETTPTTIYEGGPGIYVAMAINPANDHLFVNFGTFRTINGVYDRAAIVEFGSGEADNPLLDKEVAEVCCTAGYGLAIDASRGRLYATDQDDDGSPRIIRVFELAAPHNPIEPVDPIDGSSTPAGSFLTPSMLSLAVDESTGNIFAFEQEKRKVIYELSEDGQYLSTISHNFSTKERKQQVAVDNGASSPNGALNPEGRFIWATSDPPGVGHAFAFKPTNVTAPEVVSLSFDEVTEDEALLQASINPGQAATTYTFEYVSRAGFDASGFQGAQVAGGGTIAAGTLPVAVSAEATGLAPGTEYVFRVRATNEASPPIGEEEGSFKTYPAISFAPCPNDERRGGPSAALPDCRAYELVTPSDTAGRPPLGMGLQSLPFPSLPAAPDGNSLSFRIENGIIPGFDATSSLSGDPYTATRGPDGWETVATGPDGTEAGAAVPGGRSPDQAYSAWGAEISGPALINGERTVYVRHPDGHSELFGKGSLGVDPNFSGNPKAGPKLISAGAGHMIFASTVRLEKAAQPTGKFTVYDRTADGVTHVVSLLPGNLTPSNSKQVEYLGSSLDGRGVAFTVSEGTGVPTLYLRHDNQVTFEIGDGLTFEGVAEGGHRIFYLKSGSLYAFDAASGKTIPFATPGNVTVVNVSADGSTAYFISPSKLTSIPNPLGDKALAGTENLYRSREGSIKFVGTVTKEDVDGRGSNIRHDGLGLWVEAVGGKGTGSPGAFAIDPSRTLADGSVLLFQSNADLTDYDTQGTRQIYRYDGVADQLSCLSCNPTGKSPGGDALLQNVTEEVSFPEPSTGYDVVMNLSSSGRRAFFQSPDPLVAADTDGLTDVYEWEARGMGSCTNPGGCLYLISSGRSGKLNYLYAASASGDDVFFRTSDVLVPADREAIPSIYDARVGGGFPFLEAAQCEGEGCRPQLTPPPALPTPGSAIGRSGNVKPKCPKGKRKVKRHGKVRCVKKKKRRGDRRSRATGQKGAAR